MNIINELKQRGILKQISNEDKFNTFKPSEIAIYAGFDPTAQSLHLGNYIIISVLKRFKHAGYKVYALIGGATGMIGDPSFKDSERILLDNEQVNINKSKIKAQLESQGLEVIDNYDFYKNMNVLEFLRDAGKLVNISYMLAKDSVSSRISRGLSFTEFSYQLLQGYDFLKLYQNFNVKVQIGGSDQWGNITTGLDMISSVVGDINSKAVGITIDLLTDENGKKIGKSTGGGALWLDKKMASPFQMYQYLFNQSDLVVEKLLKWLSFFTTEEINQIMNKHVQDTKQRYAQSMLAYAIVSDLFGEDEAKNSVNVTKILFDKTFDATSLNVNEIAKLSDYLPVVEIEKNANIIEKLIETKHILSKREAREFIQNKALKVDGQTIVEDSLYIPQHFEGQYAIFNKGKKQTILLKTI
ncbi:tyrosine--tRNA ligase [Mycoplasmopsis mucosicanis]|uniref:Tyrosine--tRNA ligase n=1 Tax=Mycoplasmopsis mucosicanis TaxID=458208 RepID=A0A507SI36_9BACT|nr:tyrosine--tRNA ligase [Mycoplasmopsis mucosicanis]TQC51539.1 tyrosine--tRNA ligase [Mycoplasmopsis mucosicanis]